MRIIIRFFVICLILFQIGCFPNKQLEKAGYFDMIESDTVNKSNMYGPYGTWIGYCKKCESIPTMYILNIDHGQVKGNYKVMNLENSKIYREGNIFSCYSFIALDTNDFKSQKNGIELYSNSICVEHGNRYRYYESGELQSVTKYDYGKEIYPTVTYYKNGLIKGVYYREPVIVDSIFYYNNDELCRLIIRTDTSIATIDYFNRNE